MQGVCRRALSDDHAGVSDAGPGGRGLPHSETRRCPWMHLSDASWRVRCGLPPDLSSTDISEHPDGERRGACADLRVSNDAVVLARHCNAWLRRAYALARNQTHVTHIYAHRPRRQLEPDARAHRRLGDRRRVEGLGRRPRLP